MKLYIFERIKGKKISALITCIRKIIQKVKTTNDHVWRADDVYVMHFCATSASLRAASPANK